jgi:hypothetical protein
MQSKALLTAETHLGHSEFPLGVRNAPGVGGSAREQNLP